MAKQQKNKTKLALKFGAAAVAFALHNGSAVAADDEILEVVKTGNTVQNEQSDKPKDIKNPFIHHHNTPLETRFDSQFIMDMALLPPVYFAKNPEIEVLKTSQKTDEKLETLNSQQTPSILSPHKKVDFEVSRFDRHNAFFAILANGDEEIQTEITAQLDKLARQNYGFAFTEAEVKKGDKGNIKQMQQLLSNLGCYDRPGKHADGSFGQETKKAIKTCQTYLKTRYANIKVDGRATSPFLLALAYEGTKNLVFKSSQNIHFAMPHFTKDDIDVFARTIWGEGRGKGTEGMTYVANNLMNRYWLSQTSTQWAKLYGRTPTEVAQKGVKRGRLIIHQYSVWNTWGNFSERSNHKRAMTVTDKNSQFKEAKAIAKAALSGMLFDHVHGATNYYATYMRTPPPWAKTMTKTSIKGGHVYLSGSTMGPILSSTHNFMIKFGGENVFKQALAQMPKTKEAQKDVQIADQKQEKPSNVIAALPKDKPDEIKTKKGADKKQNTILGALEDLKKEQSLKKETEKQKAALSCNVSRLVFYGDSITEGLSQNASKHTKTLKTIFSTQSQGVKVLDLAIVGSGLRAPQHKTLKGYLSKIKKDDFVVISLGTNDMADVVTGAISRKSYLQNLKNRIEAVKEKTPNIVILGTSVDEGYRLYPDPRSSRKAWNRISKQFGGSYSRYQTEWANEINTSLNDGLKDIAIELNIPFVDTHDTRKKDKLHYAFGSDLHNVTRKALSHCGPL